MSELCNPGVKSIVFMMNLVHLVKEGVMMEAPMPPVEHEIIEVVQKQDLQ